MLRYVYLLWEDDNLRSLNVHNCLPWLPLVQHSKMHLLGNNREFEYEVHFDVLYSFWVDGGLKIEITIICYHCLLSVAPSNYAFGW